MTVIRRMWENAPTVREFRSVDELMEISDRADDMAMPLLDEDDVESIMIMFKDGHSVSYSKEEEEGAPQAPPKL